LIIHSRLLLIDPTHHVTVITPSEKLGHASRFSRANARTTISLATVEHFQDPGASCQSQQQRPVCGVLTSKAEHDPTRLLAHAMLVENKGCRRGKILTRLDGLVLPLTAQPMANE
jgi:hypothetical protein